MKITLPSLRPYRPADLAEVLDVWARASALAHPFLDRDFLEQERQSIATVHLPRAETWVWETEGRVVGFVSLLGNEIGAIFVAPESQRSGIGRAFLNRARALRGELEVEVFERNVLGRAFYERMGFELMHRKIHDPTGFEILRLRLAVAPARPEAETSTREAIYRSEHEATHADARNPDVAAEEGDWEAVSGDGIE